MHKTAEKTFRMKDFAHKSAPDAVRLLGLIGQRFEGSRQNRLIHQENDHLLWPFQEHCEVGYYPNNQPKPGIRGDWQGEFMGTWLDAAILTAWNTHDQNLREKIDGLVNDWLATQAPDGYLGTYDEKDRWKSWDIWVQAHDLIGIFSYYRLTSKHELIDAAVRIADRLLQDFGKGKRTMRDTGPHMGMASSAILEPIIWLYWETGDQRYLDFGRWLVDEDWESPGGAQLLSAILSGRGVANVGNAKGIEMLIDFAGLLELYRATGEERYFNAIQMAWEDIVHHHLYITGSASTGEFFPKDFVLRNEGVYMIGETCVSMGWLYLNLSLGRLTGDGKYFDIAEQTLYNHLMAAQSPDGRNWVYYMGLRDSKRYRWHTDPECCPSRGVRAVAQMPTHVITLFGDGLMVNFYDRAEAHLTLDNGSEVVVNMETDYPYDGHVAIQLQPAQSEAFTLRLRVPGWCHSFELRINGSIQTIQADEKGYLVIQRTWKSGDLVELDLDMPVQAVVDTLGNPGKVALTRGPLVFSADQSYLPPAMLLDDILLDLDQDGPAKGVQVVKNAESGSVHLLVTSARIQPSPEIELWREKERYRVLTNTDKAVIPVQIELVPFLEAGVHDPRNFREGIQPNSESVTHISYQVWLPFRA